MYYFSDLKRTETHTKGHSSKHEPYFTIFLAQFFYYKSFHLFSVYLLILSKQTILWRTNLLIHTHVFLKESIRGNNNTGVCIKDCHRVICFYYNQFFHHRGQHRLQIVVKVKKGVVGWCDGTG